MRITFGSTRMVILTDAYAIKIARFRLVRPILQLIRHLINGEVKTRLQKFDKDPVTGGFKYLLAGVRANQTEWHVYNTLKLDILAPTLWSFHGLINVQRRGTPVSVREMSAHVIHRLLFINPIDDSDVFQTCQFCKIQKRVVLLDYGRMDLIPALLFYKKVKSPA